MSMRTAITIATPAPSPWLTSAPYGLALAVGAAIALLIGVPGATGFDAVRLAGALALPLTVAASLGGAARLSLWRARSSVASLLLTIGVGIALALPLLAIFGTLLKAQTHNRALGGVTFAIAGLAILLFTLALGWRARRLAGTTAMRPVAISAVAAALVVFAWVLVRAKLSGASGIDWFLLFAAPALGAWGLALRRGVLGWVCWAAAFALAIITARAPGKPFTHTRQTSFGGFVGLFLDSPPARPTESTP